jgi:hypothetical protein
MYYTKSKQIKANYNYYKNNFHNLPRTLHDAYGTFSYAKEQAYNYWLNYVRTHNAKDLRILSHNCMHFTLGFMLIENGEEHFCWITAYNNRYCKIKDLEEYDY